MKPVARFLTLLAFLLILSVSALAQRASLEETLDWLKGKLTDEYPVGLTLPSTDKVVVESIEIIRFDGCEIVWRLWLDDSPAKTEWIVRLADFDPTKVKVREFGGIWRVELNAYNSKPKIKQNLIGKSGQVVPLSGRKDCFFDFDSKEMAERIAKAFAHAIKLCGGKKEPF